MAGRRSSSLIQLGGSEGKIVASDPILSVLPTIDAAHHEIHKGSYFGASYIWDPIADDASAEMLIVIGSPLHFHATPSGAAGGDAFAYIFEDPTFTTPPGDYGTVVAIGDFNRVSDNTSQLSVYRDPTLLTDGSQMIQRYIPGGAGPAQFSTGGAATTRVESIMAAGKIYLLRITNKSGSSQPISIEIEGYEHS